MTQEDIIALARQAGIAKHGLGWTCWEGQLERFATLVEERTHTKNKARWYQEGVEAEREACAQTIESLPGCSQYYPHVPDIIRERSST
jgi:hypothetical protein